MQSFKNGIDKYNIMIRGNELRLSNWTLDKKGNYFKIRPGAQIDQSQTLSAIPLTNTMLEDFNPRDFCHRYVVCN